MEEILNKIGERFAISAVSRARENLFFCNVEAGHLRSVLLHLRDIELFGHLVLITAVDRIEANRFQLTYLLHSYQTHHDIGIRVMIDRDRASMESVHDLWNTAATYQRELKEMFGIDFPNSPRVNESFILEGWHEIPPYRRDFDTRKYSEETFFPRPGRETHDPAEYMKQQLYAEEDQTC